MGCSHTGAMLHRLADAELGRLSAWRVRRHLARCQFCAWRFEEIGALGAAIRTTLPYHRASPALAARIGADRARDRAPATRPAWHWRPSAIGFSGALAGVVLTVLVQSGLSEHADETIGRAVIAAHTEAMTGGHLIDIPTSDQHVVKPWLSARRDVSPPVVDLKGQGFPLIGGRLDTVGGHKAAVVVYKHREHVVELYAWNAGNAPDMRMRTEARQGFHTIAWRQGGMELVVVSDIPAAELAEFVAKIAAPG